MTFKNSVLVKQKKKTSHPYTEYLMMIKMRNKQHSPVQQCTKNKNKEGEMTEA
jgi:hypothetical protein